MKIKNVEIGGYIQSKKDSKQLIAGHCYQVAEKDVSDKTVRLFSVDDSFDDSLWFFVSDFRKPRPQPQLKQLDQSIFDGLDEKWRFAAVDGDGRAHKCNIRPQPHHTKHEFYNIGKGFDFELIGIGYDATDWQNSLIEREKVELTGSDLARIVLSKQFMQACLVSDTSDELALSGDDLQLIRMYNESEGKFISMRDPWHGCHHKYAVAVDNNRKPLTQSDVGL